MTESRWRQIQAGRHPVVEQVMDEPFIANPIDLTTSASQRCDQLAGPNMGGKSTYMRPTALSLMAHIGCYVPAKRYRSSIDRIFTRIGASDDLASWAFSLHGLKIGGNG